MEWSQPVVHPNAGRYSSCSKAWLYVSRGVVGYDPWRGTLDIGALLGFWTGVTHGLRKSKALITGIFNICDTIVVAEIERSL